jgi:hypothetical protein
MAENNKLGISDDALQQSVPGQEGDAQWAFQALARALLVARPSIRHEWQHVPSATWGSRIDLVCGGGTAQDVWATLRRDVIAVGTNREHTDFEAFGGRVSGKELALEAFAFFERLLRDNSY